MALNHTRSPTPSPGQSLQGSRLRWDVPRRPDQRCETLADEIPVPWSAEETLFQRLTRGGNRRDAPAARQLASIIPKYVRAEAGSEGISSCPSSPFVLSENPCGHFVKPLGFGKPIKLHDRYQVIARRTA
jgi:hypothetical protein